MNTKLKLRGTNANCNFSYSWACLIFESGSGAEFVLSKMVFYKPINKKGAQIRSVYLKAYVTYVKMP